MQNAFQTKKTAGNGAADRLMVQAAVAGDSPAIDALLGRLSCVPRFVFRLNRTLGTALPAEALEDVVQQVYAALWPRLPEFHGRNPLETWVFGFCRNCLRSAERRGRDHRRAASLSPELLATLEATAASPQHLLDRGEVLGALRDALAELPVQEREVVEARHFDGSSFEDLARATGVAVSTIKDRCYRAMQRLNERLGRRMVGR